MDNKGFEMQNEPPPDYPNEKNEVVLSTGNLQNGYRNGRVSPAKDDVELAAAREKNEKEQEKRDREPLRFIRWITDRTGLWFGKEFISVQFTVVVRSISLCIP